MRIAVVGAGVVGLSTTASLVRSGADVVCFEAAGAVMGERSAGSSRIFRLAHTAPDLVRYAEAAGAGFDAWASRSGTPMLDVSGCVVSGIDAADRARAMAEAGVRHDLVDDTSGLGVPARSVAGPALVDRGGGVVDVDAVRRHLLAEAGRVVRHERVRFVDEGTVSTADGIHAADVVVLAAGADTPGLAAPAGIDLPSALEHHVRFTFALPADAGPTPAWIDHPADGLSTYQHRTGPGRWSVGATLDPELVAWANGRDAAEAASEKALLDYARERLTVAPAVVDRLYCTHAPDTGDGIVFRRSGPVLAVYGENLMKFAPMLGETLAAAALDGSTPADLG